MALRTVLTLVTAVANLTGCCAATESYVTANVKQRAAFDLECPQEELQLIRLGDKAVGVRGCGKKTAYALHQCTGSYTCDACVIQRDAEMASAPEN